MHYVYSDHALDFISLPGDAYHWIELFRDALEAWKSWYRYESMVKVILNISSFQVFEQPVE